MPKIIEGLRLRLLCEAEKQMTEKGYAAMKIRSVAKSCQVAVGTVYNYFPSKEVLAASVLLDRWKLALSEMERVAEAETCAEEVLRCIYQQLCAFMDQYRVLFLDEAAVAVFGASIAQYHDLLRQQLAKPLQRFCESEFEAEFIAESLLTWTVAGEGFEEIYCVIQKIFK